MNHRLIALLGVGTAACGVGGAGGGAEGSSARDSAGITIVENAAPTWSEAERWTIGSEPLVVLPASDGQDPTGLLDPTSVDIDSRGRIIVGDGNQTGWDAILVFDSSGAFQFKAGRDGRGPGEFGQLWWASTYRGDSLLAFDMSGDRLTVFSPDGVYARDVTVPNFEISRPAQGTYGYTRGADAAYSDGHFLAYPEGTLDISAGPGPAWYVHRLLRLSPDGASWDTLGVFEISQQYWTGTTQEMYWFSAVAASATTDDRLYFSRGERFEVGEYDARGQLSRLIRRTHTTKPVTDDLKAALREWYLERASSSRESSPAIMERVAKSFDEGHFATTLPPISKILVDDTGNLWVESFRWIWPGEPGPVPVPATWSVFNPEGVWLGDVETPVGLLLWKVTGDRVAGFMVNEDDVREVHVYRLRRGEG